MHLRLSNLEAKLASTQRALERAEAELRAQQQLTTFLAHSPFLVYSLQLADPAGTLFVSPEPNELLGYTLAEWLQVDNRWFAHVHPDDLALIGGGRVARLQAEGGRDVLEYRLRHREGHYVWLRDEAMLIRDEAGRPTTLQGFVQPCERRKRVEASLRTAEANYRSLADNLPDPMLQLNSELQVSYMNPTATRVLGVPFAELVGRRYDEIGLPPDLNAKWCEAIEHVFATGNPLRVVVQVPGSSGPRIMEARHVPEQDGSGATVGVLTIFCDITERQAAQERLRVSEERLRMAIDTGNMLTFEVELPSLQLAFTAVSSRLGAPPPEQRPTSFEESLYANIHPDDQAMVMGHWEQAIAGRCGLEYESRFHQGNGSYRWALIRASFVPGGQGQPDRMIGIVLDVTERHAMEEALRASEGQLRCLNTELEQRVAERTRELEHANVALAQSQRFAARLMETAPVEVFVFNARTNELIFTNRSYQALLGYSDEEIAALGPEPLSRLMHPDDWARFPVAERAYEQMSDSDVHTDEYRLRAVDGRWRWFASRDVVFTRDADGRPLQMLGVALDISERQAAYARLDLAYRQLEGLNNVLRRSRDLLRTIIDGLESGLALLDRDGAVVAANTFLARLYGLSAPPAGVRWDTLCPTSAAVAAQAQREGRPVSQRFELPRPNNQPLTLEALALPVSGGGQELAQVVLHVVDITERLQLEAVAMQNERHAAAGRLAAIVAHEVNSPLQAVQNFLFLAASDDPEERDSYLRLIAEEIDRIGALIRRLLNLRTTEQHEPGTVSLNGVVERVLQLIGATLTRRRIALATALSPALPAVAARPDDLTQVLLNLCLNALDAMPSGGTLRIRTGISSSLGAGLPAGALPERMLYLEVGDTGSGIAPADLARIFEPYFTTKASGTGLGLAICNQLVEQYGGLILAESAPNSGSVFTVLLPAATT